MAHPKGEAGFDALRLDFDRRLKLEFHGSKITSDAGLLAYRELDDALGLMQIAGPRLTDPRTGKNGRHELTGLLRQSTFGRLAGYEDVNDADRLWRDPAMRWIRWREGGAGGARASQRRPSLRMSALGQKQTLEPASGLSALPPKADIFALP